MILRRRFIVKPRIQIKYMVISAVVVVLTGLAVYYAFWSSLIQAPGMDQFSAGEMRALERAYQTSFFWVLLFTAVAIGIESIFFFHRLIGPLFGFQLLIRRLAGGDLSVQAHTRKGDELKDMEAEIQTMVMAMRSAVEEDRRRALRAADLLGRGELDTVREELRNIGVWFKTE